jgi:hypothetical protein
MTSLEFIKKEIAMVKKKISMAKSKFTIKGITYYQLNEIKEEINILQDRLQTLQQIKDDLEIMEMIKSGWSGMETTISGKQIMKFQNFELNEWIELWQRMEECLLKRSLEVENE